MLIFRSLKLNIKLKKKRAFFTVPSFLFLLNILRPQNLPTTIVLWYGEGAAAEKILVIGMPSSKMNPILHISEPVTLSEDASL